MILTVLDTETTGLDADIHEIIQIATISYVVSAEGDRYVTKKFEKKKRVENKEFEKSNRSLGNKHSQAKGVDKIKTNSNAGKSLFILL